MAALQKDIELLRQETKKDMELLRQETKKDIELLRQETKKDIELLRQETKKDLALIQRDIEAVKSSLIKWIFGGLITQGGLIVTLVVALV